MTSSPQTMADDVTAWAVVTAVTADGHVTIEVSDDSACATASCGAAGLGCRTNAFAHLLKRAPALHLHLPNEQLVIGDRLLLALSQNTLTKASLLAYLLPMLLMLIAMFAGQSLAGDLAALFWGLFALVSSWYLVGKFVTGVQPRVLSIEHQSIAH